MAMKKLRRKLKKKLLILAAFTVMLSIPTFYCEPTVLYAHSGRTDAQGGHHDYKNKSGLGSYHYHCGGYPAHLHENGVCPYTGAGSSSATESSSPAQKEPEHYITVNEYPSSLYQGESGRIDYSSSEASACTITSSDSSVVKVNSDNTVQAVGIGTANITIASADAEKTVTITVKEVMAEDLQIELEETVQVGGSAKINTTVLPDNTTNKSLTYAASDDNVATVSEHGVVKGIGVGEATISVTTSNGITREAAITVYQVEPEKIQCEDNIKLVVGDKHKLKINILPENAQEKDYQVSVDNQEIASYAKGKITAKKEGETDLHIVTWNQITKDIHIKVDAVAVKDIEVSDSTDYIVGNIIDNKRKIQLEAKVVPENATYQEHTWESSNPDVVEVKDNDFVVKGTGKVKLICTAHDGISKEIEIGVANKKVVGFFTPIYTCVGVVLAAVLIRKKSR